MFWICCHSLPSFMPIGPDLLLSDSFLVSPFFPYCRVSCAGCWQASGHIQDILIIIYSFVQFFKKIRKLGPEHSPHIANISSFCASCWQAQETSKIYWLFSFTQLACCNVIYHHLKKKRRKNVIILHSDGFEKNIFSNYGLKVKDNLQPIFQRHGFMSIILLGIIIYLWETTIYHPMIRHLCVLYHG